MKHHLYITQPHPAVKGSRIFYTLDDHRMICLQLYDGDKIDDDCFWYIGRISTYTKYTFDFYSIEID